MMDNGTLYFRIRRLRPTSCDHGLRSREGRNFGREISFPAQSFVSLSRRPLAPVLPIWLPPFCICFFGFALSGRRRRNGEQQHTGFWHDSEIFPPKITKKWPRPRVSQSAPGGVKTGIGT